MPVGKSQQHAPPPLPDSHYLGERPPEPPPALIKGVLPQTGVAAIVGQSGAAKTFHALHLSTCLMPDCKRDRYVDRYRVKRKGGVLYFVMEGRPAFPTRAASASSGIDRVCRSPGTSISPVCSGATRRR
jgi:hypothetical protein